MLKRFKFKQFASKAVLLSALLTTGATVIAQSASSVTLELFNAKPSESSQATASLEIGSGGGNLEGIETPEKAGKARYLRAKVATASGVENFVYRVIGNPNNGRIFIITPERKAIALNKFLASTGLEVGADKTVKLGSQVDFASTNATVMESGSSGTSMVAGSTTEASTTSATASTAPVETTTPAASTTATDSSTTGSTPAGSTPADASATTPAPTTPAADSSTAAPADPSTAATTEASTTPATTATPDASTAPATDANATDANATAAAPATDANAAAPASSTATTEAAALTAPVSTTVGKVELTVIPAGAAAPVSSEKNLILAPVANATEATSSVEGNTVTLSYTSSSSIDDVSKFYDDQLKAQGFTPDLADATNQKTADQFVKVYKRGTASMTMSVKNENGAYQVEVDLESLANGN